jgi:hypothetical protein
MWKITFKILYALNLFLFCLGNYTSVEDDLDQFVKEYMFNNTIIGLGLILAVRENVKFEKNFGFQDKEKNIPIDTKQSLFRWASMSKMLTSCMTFSLKNKGLLNINEDISKYNYEYHIPQVFTYKCHSMKNISFQNSTFICEPNDYAYIPISLKSQITIRQLLSHWGGILDYENGPYNPVPPNEMINSPIINSGLEWAVKYFKNFPLINPPNYQYNYTTFGYNLLGLTLSKITKTKYIELANSILRLNEYGVIPDYIWLKDLYPNRCVGYINGTRSTDNDVTYKLPGGGFMSTIRNALDFLLNNIIYSYEFLTLSDRQIAWTNINNTDYGLGFQIFNKSRNIKNYGIGHTGSQEKAKNLFIHYPIRNMTLLIMSNSENLEVYDFLGKFEDFYFKDKEEELIFIEN